MQITNLFKAFTTIGIGLAFGRAMTRLIPLLLLAAGLLGCGDNVDEYVMSAATIEAFSMNAENLAQRDDEKSPLAMSVLSTNQIGAPPSVQVWNPDPTMQSVGIINGDMIALIDGEVPSREYGHSFAANQKPFGSATEQYVHFVSSLLALHESRDSVLLSIHKRYETMAEREKYGSIFAAEPRLIRIVFK